MAQEKDARKVQEELAKKNSGGSEKQLTFDPTTGELIVKEQFDFSLKSNEVVVDQIYKDGFFC